ncbi:MAG TPA: alanine dehydrogenase [Acidiferrobacteraceae bacterium]|nr:alanine dehydrogenase [Acidiferrobacteraceae bacterium]
MKIGVPKEVKPLEERVALIPDAVGHLVERGHDLFVQLSAGGASGYSDELYREAGAEIVPDADALYQSAQLIVKVKEPIDSEFDRLEERHRLFSYLHLAANPELCDVLLDKGLVAVAFETVEVRGQLPLLAPMSDIAGRLSVQIGATLLHRYHGGRGLLLGGLAAAERGSVVVLGAGSAGGKAAATAAALGAEVTVFARARASLEKMRQLGNNVTALYAFKDSLVKAVQNADLLVGAVLVPGAKAPQLIDENLVSAMKPGSVIVDIAVDQGGCIETTHPTDYTAPTYVSQGVVHFAVTNMPAAVPRSASQALSAALIPYVTRLAEDDWQQDEALQRGINVAHGKMVNSAVAEALNLKTN